MLARISTVFDCTAEQLWDELSRPAIAAREIVNLFGASSPNMETIS